MSEILPLFASNGSIGKSILTIEKENDITADGPVSIYSIVKQYNLNKILIIDNSFLLFNQIYKNFADLCEAYFGVNFTICEKSTDKTEESFKTESRISIVMKNSKGYKDLLKLHNYVSSNEDYFYYIPRLDWGMLTSMWTENLELIISQYDSFLDKNLFYGYNCIPKLGKIKPILLYSNMGLPFDDALSREVKNSAEKSGFQSLESHPIYYYRRSDFKAYMNYRCINNRSNFTKPNLDYLSSDEFCWESYCQKANIEFNR